MPDMNKKAETQQEYFGRTKKVQPNVNCSKCKHCFEEKRENKKVRYCYLCGAAKPEFRVESKHLAHLLPDFKKFNTHGTSHISIHICEKCFLKIFDKEIKENGKV